MITLDSISFLAVSVMALSLKPGPCMMMVMTRAMTQGMGAALTCVLGFLIIGFTYLIVVFISFKIPDVDMVLITTLLKSIAAVYLIWIGIKGLNEANLFYTDVDIEEHYFFDTLSTAMMVSISNPLVMVFYAGLLPTMMDVHLMGTADMAIVLFVVLAIEGIIPIFYCIPFLILQKKISEKFLKGMKNFSSIVIILIGLYIGYSALPTKEIFTFL